MPLFPLLSPKPIHKHTFEVIVWVYKLLSFANDFYVSNFSYLEDIF